MKLRILPLLAAFMVGVLSHCVQVSSIQIKVKPLNTSQQPFVKQNNLRRLENSTDQQHTARVSRQLQQLSLTATSHAVLNAPYQKQGESLLQLFGNSYLRKLKKKYRKLKKKYKKLYSSSEFDEFKYKTMIPALERVLNVK